MRKSPRILKCVKAKSKKNIIGIIVTIGMVGLVGSFFIGMAGAALGIIISIVIVAGVGAGAYFLLKRYDDLPDVLN